MTELIWNGRILAEENPFRLDIREMATIESDNGVIFVTAGGYNGGLMSVSVDAGGDARLLHETSHGPNVGELRGLSTVVEEVSKHPALHRSRILCIIDSLICLLLIQ